VKTYIYFLLILANILVTYSVVSESILFPEKELKADILYSVFRRGFWAMLGEYFLDEIELFSDDTSNNSDTANSSMRGVRPTEDGKYSIPILLAVYVLFVQILMFNLLIALFNNAISENETKGRMIWSHQKFLLTMQYSKTKILLPPFIILSFCLKEKFGNPFKTKKGDKVNILKKFEREAAKMIINQIIKQRYVNKFSHDDTKVASVAQVKNMEKKLMKLSGSLRQLMPKYDFLRAKEVQDKRRTDVPEKDVELKKMIERLEKMSFKKKGHGDSDDTPRNDQEINVSAEVTDCQQGSSKLIEDKLSNVDGN
ncbi:transient receptor potential cation channel subfamily M member 2, partial [Biomphalaria glabrata]